MLTNVSDWSESDHFGARQEAQVSGGAPGEILQEELRSLERRAQAAQKVRGRAWTRNTATQMSGLAKQTVSGWFSKSRPRVPADSDELWKLVTTYSHWANEKASRKYWDDLWGVAQRATLVDRKLSSPSRRISEWTDPFSLEVHRSIDSGAEALGLPALPTYVRRPHDDELDARIARAEAGQNTLAILVGESSTGKTRACWEAVQKISASWTLWHPIYPGHAEALMAALEDGIPPRTVLWLNETQLYLQTPASNLGERVAAGLRELMRRSELGPILILGTIWTENWDNLTRPPQQSGSDSHTQARSLLGNAGIPVPSSFFGEALEDLKSSANSDPRLLAAYTNVADTSARIAQFLAGAPAIMERYQNAPFVARSILESAIDLRRMGYTQKIPGPLLADMAGATMETDIFDSLPSDWFEDGLDYALAKCVGTPGPISRVRARRISAKNNEATYRVADYLEQTGGESRRFLPLHPKFLDVVIAHVDQVDQLKSIASALEHRGRQFWAAQLYLRACDLGDFESSLALAAILSFAGDPAGAAQTMRIQCGSSDPRYGEFLAFYLHRSGQVEAAEEVCISEFNRGNLRPLLRLKEAYELADTDTSIDDLHAKVISSKYPEIFKFITETQEEFHTTLHKVSTLVANRLRITREHAELQVLEEIDLALPRIKSLSEAMDLHAREMQDSVRRLRSLVEDSSEDERRREVKEMRARISLLEQAGEIETARKLITDGLNAGIIGLETLGSHLSLQDESNHIEYIEGRGIDWDGALNQPWKLSDVRRACYKSLRGEGL